MNNEFDSFRDRLQAAIDGRKAQAESRQSLEEAAFRRFLDEAEESFLETISYHLTALASNLASDTPGTMMRLSHFVGRIDEAKRKRFDRSLEEAFFSPEDHDDD